MLDLLDHFGWTYISLLYADEPYGYGARSALKLQIKQREQQLCLAYEEPISLGYTRTDYARVISNLRKNSKARVVIVFLTSPTSFFTFLYQAGIFGEFIFIVSDTFHFNLLKGMEEIALGAFAIRIPSKNCPEFERYYSKQTPWNKPANPWYSQLWSEMFNCQWKNNRTTTSLDNDCLQHQSIVDYKKFSFRDDNTRVIDATQTFIEGLNSLINEKCLHAVNLKNNILNCVQENDLLSYLSNVNFEGVTGDIAFDKNRDILAKYEVTYVMKTRDMIDEMVVGTWNMRNGSLNLKDDSLQWYVNSSNEVLTKTTDEHLVTTETSELVTTVPESVCAKPCLAGEIYIFGELECCWECHRCFENQIVVDNETRCEACPDLMWPDNYHASCQVISPVYLTLSAGKGLALGIVAGLGLLMTAVITSIFCYHRHTKVVKGSTSEMMFMILIGGWIAYSGIYTFLFRPESWLCNLSWTVFVMSCTMLSVPLLLKTWRIYRIFRSSEKMRVGGLKFAGPGSQMIMTFSLYAAQVETFNTKFSYLELLQSGRFKCMRMRLFCSNNAA